MHSNLKAEMGRKGITIGNIADFLGVRHATISDKINCKFKFYYDEALAIRDHFFPNCSLEYLFESEQKTA